MVVDADSGAIIAGTIGGWSCSASNPPAQFDGSFDIERLPVNRNYNLYAEPLDGLAIPGDFGVGVAELCASNGTTVCTVPAVNATFNPRYFPGSP